MTLSTGHWWFLLSSCGNQAGYCGWAGDTLVYGSQVVVVIEGARRTGPFCLVGFVVTTWAVEAWSAGVVGTKQARSGTCIAIIMKVHVVHVLKNIFRKHDHRRYPQMTSQYKIN